MAEKMAEVYEMYDMQIDHIGRGRGAIVLHTDKGIRQVRAVLSSESRLATEYEFKEKLYEAGYANTDRVVKNTEGELITYDRYGNPFAMRMYFEGREMNVTNKQEILLAVDNLVYLHKAGREAWCNTESDMLIREKNNIRRRNRELKRIINYVSKQSPKREFEALYMKAFPYFYAQGLACERAQDFAQDMAQGLACERAQDYAQNMAQGLVGERAKREYDIPGAYMNMSKSESPVSAISNGYMPQYDGNNNAHIGYCHGAYNHHSVLMCSTPIAGTITGSTAKTANTTTPALNNVATINFDRFHVGNQLEDLYYFMRKTVEKNGYSFELLTEILMQYKKGIDLNQNDFQYIYGLYRYPEKFYKLSNQYMNSNKNRISPKMIEKLNRIIEEEDKKQLLLDKMHIFSSHL